MKQKLILASLLGMIGCVHAQTKLATPTIILGPADASNGAILEVQDSTQKQFVGLRTFANLPVTTITAATAANPMVLTFVSSMNVSVNSVIVIEGAIGTGCSVMNGPQTVTVAGGTSITISLDGTGCTYTASSASASTAFWTLPITDATNALCGNSNSTWSFACTEITLSDNVASGKSLTITENGNAAYGAFVQSLGNNSIAGYFYNGTNSTLSPALEVVNNGGGAGAGLAASLIGSVNMQGGSSASEWSYNAPGNNVQLVDNNGAFVYYKSIPGGFSLMTGSDSALGVVQGDSGGSTANVVEMGFISSTVPAIATSVSSSVVAGLPLPSNTPTAGYVLTGNGAGVATSWQPGGGGSTPTWTPFATSAGSFTITSQTSRYSQNGKTTIVRIEVTGTYTGTSGDYLTLSLPFGPLDNNQTFAVAIKNSVNTFWNGGLVGPMSGTTITVGELSGFSNGSTYTIIVQGPYETF